MRIESDATWQVDPPCSCTSWRLGRGSVKRGGLSGDLGNSRARRHQVDLGPLWHVVVTQKKDRLLPTAHRSLVVQAHLWNVVLAKRLDLAGTAAGLVFIGR